MRAARMRGVTLAARPAIVFPTAAYRKARPVERHPLIMTAAELRCLRESLGLTIRALAKAVNHTERNISRWENAEQPISRRSAEALVDLVAYTDETLAAVVATHASGSTIITYRSDEEFQERFDTGGRALSASWHRMVAWRAAQQIPGAVITYAA